MRNLKLVLFVILLGSRISWNISEEKFKRQWKWFFPCKGEMVFKLK